MEYKRLRVIVRIEFDVFNCQVARPELCIAWTFTHTQFNFHLTLVHNGLTDNGWVKRTGSSLGVQQRAIEMQGR